VDRHDQSRKNRAFLEIREGDALETLKSGLPSTIDLLLLDGAKSLYPEILELAESRLRLGALVVADNADPCPEYLERVRSPASGYMSVSVADNVMLTMRVLVRA
jgi:predicted O-methyltransferase YrrM